MINVIRYEKNYATAWQQYVEQHAEATPYHRRGWLESITQAYGFSVIDWIAVDDKDNVVGLLAAAVMKTPLLGKKITALPYCDAGGVLADDKDIEAQLIAAALRFSGETKVRKFEHRQVDLTLSDEALLQQTKVRMVLPLPESAESLMASFKSKLRSQIRKAEKNGLTASVGSDKKHLDGFYQVYARNMRDLGSPAHSKRWFNAILSNFKQDAIIANVYYEQTVVGAGIVLKNGNRCSIPWASTNADFNRLAPNMLLYWTLLAHVSDNQAVEFDFGRSTPGEGTFKFKKQWGAEPSGLNWNDYSDGQLLAAETASNKDSERRSPRELVENVWRRLPVGLATALGSSLRKYISL